MKIREENRQTTTRTIIHGRNEERQKEKKKEEEEKTGTKKESKEKECRHRTVSAWRGGKKTLQVVFLLLLVTANMGPKQTNKTSWIPRTKAVCWLCYVMPRRTSDFDGLRFSVNCGLRPPIQHSNYYVKHYLLRVSFVTTLAKCEPKLGLAGPQKAPPVSRVSIHTRSLPAGRGGGGSCVGILICEKLLSIHKLCSL